MLQRPGIGHGQVFLELPDLRTLRYALALEVGHLGLERVDRQQLRLERSFAGRQLGCPTLERNTITGQARRGLLVCARGQGTVTDNEISDNLDANVEVRGELEKFVPEEQVR